MSKPIAAELEALLAQLVCANTHTHAVVAATLRHLDDREADRPRREQAARMHALAEFAGFDFTLLADTLIQDVSEPAALITIMAEIMAPRR